MGHYQVPLVDPQADGTANERWLYDAAVLPEDAGVEITHARRSDERRLGGGGW